MRITISSDFLNISPLQLSLIRAALDVLISDPQHPAAHDAASAYRKTKSKTPGFSLAEGAAICIALCQIRDLLYQAALVSAEHPPAPFDNEEASNALDQLISRLQARLSAHGINIRPDY